MMNKKGITIGRIILYILFVFVIVFIIWSLVLTYRKIKNPNTNVKIECDSSLRMVDNNNIVINPVDNISYFTLNNITSQDFGSGSSNPFYPNSTFDSVSPVASISNTYIGSIVSNDNQFLLSDSFNNYRLNYSYISSSDSNIFVFMSIKCNINVSDFNFIVSGSAAASNFSLFYVSDNLVNSNNIITDFMRIDNLVPNTHYNLLDIRPSADYSSTKVLYFGFGLFRLKTYQNYFINSNSRLSASSNPSLPIHTIPELGSISITFDLVTLSGNDEEIYQSGYDKGYRDAIQSIDSSVDDLISQNNSLNSQVYDLTSRVNQQTQVITQLQEQLNNVSNDFKGFFFTVADVPFRTVSNILGFEFWGINLFRFFVGIITALGIIWLIKKIL